MTLRWSVYTGAVDDTRDEETLNDCFADLVDDSLARAPGFLNYLLDGFVEFESGARIEGTWISYPPEWSRRGSGLPL